MTCISPYILFTCPFCASFRMVVCTEDCFCLAHRNRNLNVRLHLRLFPTKRKHPKIPSKYALKSWCTSRQIAFRRCPRIKVLQKGRAGTHVEAVLKVHSEARPFPGQWNSDDEQVKCRIVAATGVVSKCIGTRHLANFVDNWANAKI